LPRSSSADYRVTRWRGRPKITKVSCHRERKQGEACSVLVDLPGRAMAFLCLSFFQHCAEVSGDASGRKIVLAAATVEVEPVSRPDWSLFLFLWQSSVAVVAVGTRSSVGWVASECEISSVAESSSVERCQPANPETRTATERSIVPDAVPLSPRGRMSIAVGKAGIGAERTFKPRYSTQHKNVPAWRLVVIVRR
jgi:hypothetical protein